MSEAIGSAVPGWDAAVDAGTEAHRAREAQADASSENFATDGELALAAAVPHLLDAIEAEAVKVWRCSECGKWSHAKRMPKHHQRFKQAEDAAEDEAAPVGLTVTSMEPSAYGSANPDDESFSSGGWWLRCGPFVPYHAEAARVVATYRKGFDQK